MSSVSSKLPEIGAAPAAMLISVVGMPVSLSASLDGKEPLHGDDHPRKTAALVRQRIARRGKGGEAVLLHHSQPFLEALRFDISGEHRRVKLGVARPVEQIMQDLKRN